MLHELPLMFLRVLRHDSRASRRLPHRVWPPLGNEVVLQGSTSEGCDDQVPNRVASLQDKRQRSSLCPALQALTNDEGPEHGQTG